HFLFFHERTLLLFFLKLSLARCGKAVTQIFTYRMSVCSFRHLHRRKLFIQCAGKSWTTNNVLIKLISFISPFLKNIPPKLREDKRFDSGRKQKGLRLFLNNDGPSQTKKSLYLRLAGGLRCLTIEETRKAIRGLTRCGKMAREKHGEQDVGYMFLTENRIFHGFLFPPLLHS